MWQLHSHTRCRESCSAQRALRALRPPLGGRKPSTIYKTPEGRRGAPMGIGRSSSRFPECAHGKGLSPIHHHKGHLSFSTWKGNLTSVRAGWEPLHRGPCFPRPGLQDREADRHQDWPRYTRHQVGWNGAPHSLWRVACCTGCALELCSWHLCDLVALCPKAARPAQGAPPGLPRDSPKSLTWI